MTNFKDLLIDILDEKQKTLKDLENANILGKKSFYNFDSFSPYLSTVIKIANYLEVSLDYLSGNTTENNFKKYKEDQNNFYNNIINLMKALNISHVKLSKDLEISRPNFSYWKKGTLPKFSTLLELSNYLDCSIDDFLDFE